MWPKSFKKYINTIKFGLKKKYFHISAFYFSKNTKKKQKIDVKDCWAIT